MNEEKNKIPDWFDTKLSKNLYKPVNISFNTSFINKHTQFQTYSYNKPKFKYKLKELDNNNCKKPKDFSKSITKLQNLIKETTDEKLLKKYNTSLKCSLTKQNKQTQNVGKFLKSFTIKLHLNKDIQDKLKLWFQDSINIYNICVDYFNNEKCDKNLFHDYTKLKKVIIEDYTNINTASNIPYDVMTDIVREFCSNLKSNFTKLKEKQITHFELKPKIINKYFIYSLFVSGKSIRQKGIYHCSLGQIVNFETLYNKILLNIQNNTIECDSRLIYDSFTNEYFLNIPYYSSKKEVQNQKDVVALDPGEKIFMTYYSLDECGTIGKDIRLPILKEEAKIRKYQRILSQNKNKENKKLKHKYNIRKKLKHCYLRIKNVVKDLHCQTANILTNKFKRILIPVFKTQNMLSSKNNNKENKSFIKNKIKENKAKCKSKIELKKYHRFNRLNSRVKFVMNMMSHYKFRQHLAHKCVEKGCEIIVVTEEFTSQCCGNCGTCSKTYNNRIKKCEECKFEIDRDINGSRNILIKNWKTIQE
jgi:transposase